MDFTGIIVTRTTTIHSRGTSKDIDFTYRLEGTPNSSGMVRGWCVSHKPGDADYIGKGGWFKASDVKR